MPPAKSQETAEKPSAARAAAVKPKPTTNEPQGSSSRLLLGALCVVLVGVCLYFGLPSSESNPPLSSATTRNATKLDGEWRQLRGIQVVGKELSSSKMSLPECQSTCAARADCAAYTWNEACSLKSDITPLGEARGVTSGFKHITPSRVRSPPLFEMWGNTVWKELQGSRREAFLGVVSRVIDTMIGYEEPSLVNMIPKEMKQAFSDHVTAITELQQGAGKAELAELLLLKAYIHIFTRSKKAMAVLEEAEAAATDVPQKAAVTMAKSYVLELQGSEVDADKLRATLLSVNHVFNHSYDDYLRLHLVGYAKGRTTFREYGSVLAKLFAFRRFWKHEIQGSGPGRAAWIKHFPETKNVTQGAPGVYLAGGADQEALKTAQLQLFQNDFVVLREILTPWEIKMVANYFKACLKPYYENHDSHLGRTSAYNDRINYHLNSDVRPMMEQVFGFDVQVAYSFMCHYEYYNKDPGPPELKPHTDRQDNEWTTSVQVYSEPEGLAWPIHVDKELTLPPASAWRTIPTQKGRIVKAVLPVGDAVLFMGRLHNHWRPPMQSDMKQFASILFHYVPTSFDRLRWNSHRDSSEPYN